MEQNTYKNFKLDFLKSSYLMLIPICNSTLQLSTAQLHTYMTLYTKMAQDLDQLCI